MFSERLKYLRKERHMTQEDLSRAIGVERSSIGKYEGASSNVIPSVPILFQIADLFGVSVDYLLGRTDKKESAPEVVAEFSADELQLVKDYRELNGEGQSFVRTTVRSLVVSGAYIKSRISGQVQIG